MINFRFHLVSLVAVFLALAVGIVMGYGVLGQPTVDTLQNRIDVVEANAEARRVENEQLKDDLDEQGAALDQSAPFAVSERVADARVVVVGLRGIDEEAVDRIVDLARRGGADAPGIVWLEQAWALDTKEDVAALAGALGVPTPNKRAPLRVDALDALVTRLAGGAPQTGDDPLGALVDAGFVGLDGSGEDAPGVADLGGAGTRLVLVAGPAASFRTTLVVTDAARAAVDADLPLVASEIFTDGTDGADRGDSLAAIRDDDALDASVSTVDDVERVEGAVAAVLAAADLGRGVVGHYGIGDGADRQLPEWWEL